MCADVIQYSVLRVKSLVSPRWACNVFPQCGSPPSWGDVALSFPVPIGAVGLVLALRRLEGTVFARVVWGDRSGWVPASLLEEL